MTQQHDPNYMNGIYLIIGGNLGDRDQMLLQCRQAISRHIGPIVQQSGIYETKAWGNEDTPDYLNQVLQIDTRRSANEIMDICLSIELEMGRTRQARWEARLIDIDLLFYHGDIIDRPNLHVPHPRMTDRRFVLVPLHEIAPGFIHPQLNCTVADLLADCKDPLEVHLYARSEDAPSG